MLDYTAKHSTIIGPQKLNNAIELMNKASFLQSLFLNAFQQHGTISFSGENYLEDIQLIELLENVLSQENFPKFGNLKSKLAELKEKHGDLMHCFNLQQQAQYTDNYKNFPKISSVPYVSTLARLRNVLQDVANQQQAIHNAVENNQQEVIEENGQNNLQNPQALFGINGNAHVEEEPNNQLENDANQEDVQNADDADEACACHIGGCKIM